MTFYLMDFHINKIVEIMGAYAWFRCIQGDHPHSIGVAFIFLLDILSFMIASAVCVVVGQKQTPWYIVAYANILADTWLMFGFIEHVAWIICLFNPNVRFRTLEEQNAVADQMLDSYKKQQ